MNPEALSAILGTNVVFKCTSYLNVEWTFNSHSLPQNAQDYKSDEDNVYELLIKEVNLDNTGTYECIGHDKESRSDFYSTAELTVKGKLPFLQVNVIIK